MKSLADQIPELVTSAIRDVDFVEDFFHDIKRFIISQSSVKNEIWTQFVDHALRLEEILPPSYQLASNRSTSISSGPRRGLSQFARSDRFDNSDRPSNSDRSGNWRQKSIIISSSPMPLEPLFDSDRKFLMKYKDCFRCHKIFVDHIWRNCGQDEKTMATIENNGLVKEIKQEINFISETEYQYEESEQCQMILSIILSIQLNDQIMT